MIKKDLCTNGERGIQGITPHPNFDENLLIYMFYAAYVEGCPEKTDDAPFNVIVRYRMNPDTLELDRSSKEVIWRGGKTYKNVHNGGALAFGNDGKLYVTTGDTGNQDTVQPLNNVHGSIIRLNDDGSIPNDNPFANDDEYNSYRCADTKGYVPNDAPEDAVCSEVFANGLRNPFRITMDPNEEDKVKFAISDVGGAYWEELDWGGDDFRGRNYGYPKHEGPCLHGFSHRCQQPNDNNILEPFHWYEHRDIKEGGCISGSAIIPKNSGWPSEYKLLYADFLFFDIYNLVEDADSYCRSCRPPTSGYRNETFYQVPKVDGLSRGGITDMFFGPYEDKQALYVIARDGSEQIIRIRYTEDVDNTPPIPKIKLNDLNYNYTVGEIFKFDGSKSSDADGDDLSYAWDFNDGTTSKAAKPNHAFEKPGKYQVELVVTDTAGLAQQTSMVINIGKPPTVTILSPLEGDEFYVGQIFQLRGEAYDHTGARLNDPQLTWEVRKHHADHYHPFLDPTDGNDLTLFPAPEPEDFFASTNSYLQVILKATDSDGLTSEIDRLIQPWKIDVDIESDPPGIEVTVDLYPLTTSNSIVSWKDHNLNILAKDQPPFMFKSWWDGNTESERKIKLSNAKPTLRAIYCAKDFWLCMSDEECCSESCVSMICVSSSINDSLVSKPKQAEDVSDNKPKSDGLDDINNDDEKKDMSEDDASGVDDATEDVSEDSHSINDYVSAMLEDNEKDIKEGSEDVVGKDIEAVHNDSAGSEESIDVDVLDISSPEVNYEEAVENDTVAEQDEITAIQSDTQNEAGLGMTGIALVILACIICIFLLQRYLSKKDKRSLASLTLSRADQADSHSKHGDEENCSSNIPDVYSADPNIAAVKWEDSPPSGSFQDALNHTYETSSSSSS